MPTGVYLRKPMSEETKLKIGLGNVGKSKGVKKPYVAKTNFLKRGIPLSELHKKKIGLANSIALKGRKLPLEQIEKLRERMKGNKYKLGKVPWNKGKRWGTTKTQKLEERAGVKKPDDCKICGAIGNIVFDHNHKTGKFRGWICSRCNIAIGHARDNSELLIAMADYLKRAEDEAREGRY